MMKEYDSVLINSIPRKFNTDGSIRFVRRKYCIKEKRILRLSHSFLSAVCCCFLFLPFRFQFCFLSSKLSRSRPVRDGFSTMKYSKPKKKIVFKSIVGSYFVTFRRPHEFDFGFCFVFFPFFLVTKFDSSTFPLEGRA